MIELLVVIAIIGLLSSIVLSSLNIARKKGLDARRESDMRTLELAVELYYDTNGTYPIDATTQLGDWPPAFKAQLAPYLPNPPIDPIENDSVRYYGAYRMTWATDPNCNLHYVLWGYIQTTNPSPVTCGFVSNEFFRVLGTY